MSATVVDAGDGLPLTVPALLRERAARRGDHPLLICDDRRAHVRRCRVAIGRVGEGAPRRRCRPGHARRPAASERPRVRRGLAGRGPHRRRHRAVEHVLDQRRAAHAAAQRRHRDAARHAVVPRPRLRRMRCTKRFRISTSRPRRRCTRLCARAAHASRSTTARVVDAGCRRRATTCWPPPRPACAPSDRMVIVHTSGSTSDAEGRDPPARPAHPPPRQPQRAASLHRGRGAVLELAVLLDRRLRVQPARHAARRRHARVLERDRRGRDARPARTGAADDGERVRGVGRAPREGPVVRGARPAARSGAATSGRSCPPRCGPADPGAASQHARHDRDRQRLPRERRRGRPARAPPRFVRATGSRVRGEDRRSRHRRRVRDRRRSGSCGSAARS